MTIYSTTSQSGIDIASVFTLDTATPEYPAPPFLVGELAWGTDGSEFIYCLSTTATIAAGNALIISGAAGSGTATKATSALIGTSYGQLMAVSNVAVTAISGTQTASYFWAQRAGVVPALTSIGGAQTLNAALVGSATAGQVGISGVPTLYSISGLVWSATPATAAGASAVAVANYPTAGGANH